MTFKDNDNYGPNNDPFKDYDSTINDAKSVANGGDASYAFMKGKFEFIMATVGKVIKFTIWKWYYLITIPSIFVLYKLLQNEAFLKAVGWVLIGFNKGVI
jgi:hypothetical protein